ANCSGITKQDLTRPVYWRTIQNGNLLLLYTKNWPRPEVAGVKKQKRVLTACAWSIFFGLIDPENLQCLTGFCFQLIRRRNRWPTFSMGCFSASRSNFA